MKKSLIVVALVAGCGAADQSSNQAGVSVTQSAGSPAAAPRSDSSSGRIAQLTGLYEGGQGAQPDQLCMVDKGGSTQFGLVVWGANMHSCSGSGRATRAGTTLSLAMAGDTACTIEAKIEGSTIALPATAPAGCSYYCGARAQLGGASFARKGGTAQDALKAKDLAGDPLCDSTR